MEPIKRKKTIYEAVFKRPMDLFLSLIAIIVLGPLMMILAILVRIKLGGPVLFKQARPGKTEKIFNVYKFRTMTNKKDSDGNLLPDELRLTKFGKFLRSTSLDELPSLFCILTGKMSVVGPRPLLVEYIPHYTEEEKMRHLVRPGLTGLAQVNGRNFLEWDKRLALDVVYIEKITFFGDIGIIIKTFLKVVSRKDVSANSAVVESNLAEERSTKNSTAK